MNALSDVLLPCPFCGGEAEVCVGEVMFRDVSIRCNGCQTAGPLFDKDDAASSTENEIDAKRHWNTRMARGRLPSGP